MSIRSRVGQLSKRLPQRTIINVVRRGEHEMGTPAGTIPGERVVREDSYRWGLVRVRRWERPELPEPPRFLDREE
jgi:hypothetical protein